MKAKLAAPAKWPDVISRGSTLFISCRGTRVQSANKAPEPTPGLVTPRAMECAFEMKQWNGKRVRLAAPRAVVFGRFRGGQPIAVPAGDIFYVGSALGGLAARLLRHATRLCPHRLRLHPQRRAL